MVIDSAVVIAGCVDMITGCVVVITGCVVVISNCVVVIISCVVVVDVFMAAVVDSPDVVASNVVVSTVVGSGIVVGTFVGFDVVTRVVVGSGVVEIVPDFVDPGNFLFFTQPPTQPANKQRGISIHSTVLLRSYSNLSFTALFSRIQIQILYQPSLYNEECVSMCGTDHTHIKDVKDNTNMCCLIYLNIFF